MRRRAFIGLLGGAVVWPIATHAQSPAPLARIGFIGLGAGPSPSSEGLRRGLRALGYVEGQNLVFLYRWAAGQTERLVNFVTELQELKVDVFASNTTEAIQAIRKINKTIPVVMVAISDPIGSSLVESFARPGGNTTGVTLYSTELAGKRLELLKDVAPKLQRIAILAQRNHPPTIALVEETRAAATAVGVELQVFSVHPDPEEIASAFRSISKASADAVIVQQSVSFNIYMRQVADLAISLRLPTIQQAREFVAAGGLMSYGPNLSALGQRAAYYVDRILKGTSPTDLPVEQPSTFELVVNLRTAKTLGLSIPPTVLARADEVIE